MSAHVYSFLCGEVPWLFWGEGGDASLMAAKTKQLPMYLIVGRYVQSSNCQHGAYLEAASYGHGLDQSFVSNAICALCNTNAAVMLI